MYVFMKKTIGARKNFSIWEHSPAEKWVDDNLYAFQRGDVLTLLNNNGQNGNQISQYIGHLDYQSGTQVCNVYYDNDCITLQQGQDGTVGAQYTMLNGEN